MARVRYDTSKLLATYDIADDLSEWKVVDLPDGATKWRIRLRPDDVATIFVRYGPDRIVEHLLERAGDHLMRPSVLTMGENVRGAKQSKRGPEDANTTA